MQTLLKSTSWGLKKKRENPQSVEEAGQQLALVSDKDGSALSAGGEDGKLRLFKWPSIYFRRGYDGKFLVSLGNSGTDERFGFCIFSQLNDGTQVLNVTAVTGSKHVVLDSINAFNVSADGKQLAAGTGEGDILILDSTSMQVPTLVKKAHPGLVTALNFSYDSRAVISVSMDSSARVTLFEDEKASGGVSMWLIILSVLLAIATYCGASIAAEYLQKVSSR